mgnify:CR=1 FL=1
MKKGLTDFKSFDCCGLEAHIECWDMTMAKNADGVRCTSVRHLLKKDRKSPIFVYHEDPDREIVRKYAVCEYCGINIEVATASSTHLKDDCITLKGLCDKGRGLPGETVHTCRLNWNV